jgi:serine protease
MDSVENPQKIIQWNIHFIQAKNYWDEGYNGWGRIVAILDSGIAASSMPMFENPMHDGNSSSSSSRVIQGYDFVSDASISHDGDGRDGNPLDPGDADPELCTSSSSWHGTYVSSVIASSTFPGFSGIAYNSTLLSMRVLGKCKAGYASDVADALVWAVGGNIVGIENNPNPVDTVLMSFAGRGNCPSFLQSAVDMAVLMNVTIFAAAGNNPSLKAFDSFPANCKGVVSVGAIDAGGGYFTLYSASMTLVPSASLLFTSAPSTSQSQPSISILMMSALGPAICTALPTVAAADRTLTPFRPCMLFASSLACTGNASIATPWNLLSLNKGHVGSVLPIDPLPSLAPKLATEGFNR